MDGYATSRNHRGALWRTLPSETCLPTAINWGAAEDALTSLAIQETFKFSDRVLAMQEENIATETPKCSKCGAETTLHLKGVPICVTCLEAMEAERNKMNPSKPSTGDESELPTKPS